MTEVGAPVEPVIGYFAHVRHTTTAWGALVLVTTQGDPLDFFYTDPVTLNRLTHRLLGPRMDAYLVTRVLLEPLLAQAGSRLALLCFDDPAVLQRPFAFAVPVAVLAARDVPHKDGAWQAEAVPLGNGHDQTWWLASGTRAAAVAALKETAAAMSPFGITDPFQQLRAAMAEVRGENG